MFNFTADILGYLLNFLYQILQNYGFAIILFSIIIKIVLLPMMISQQKTSEKSTKLQGKMKEIQDKYRNNPEKLNKEMRRIYEEEGLNPLSGCLSSIIQIILILAMFYLIRDPLTHMLKIPEAEITQYVQEIKDEGTNINEVYKEIAIIKSGKLPENNRINMNFLGLDLSQVPSENYRDVKSLIIPILYVLTSFISIKYSMSNMNNAKKEENNKQDENPMQMGNTMMWMMPLLSVWIAMIAPLGLALYWLVNNILQLLQQFLVRKYLIKKEENKEVNIKEVKKIESKNDNKKNNETKVNDNKDSDIEEKEDNEVIDNKNEEKLKENNTKKDNKKRK